MADSNVKMPQATPREVIISVVAGLLAPLLAIFLIVQLVLGIQADHKPDSSSEVAQKATLERIKPFAELSALDASAPVVEKSGQEVYDTACVACHGSGALGAPRFGNKGDWGARIGQGYDTLVKNAIEGIRQMPPRGGNADLTDAEVARAVAYMANAAAGIAGAPKPGDMAVWGARVAQGYATLYDHALNGIRGMPAKGGNPSLSEADLANAVGYMFGESGGKL